MMEKYISGTLCLSRFKQPIPFGNALTDLKLVLERLGWKHATVYPKDSTFVYNMRRHSPGASSTLEAPNSWRLIFQSGKKITWPIQNHLLKAIHLLDADGRNMVWSENYMVPHETLISLPLMEPMKMTEGSEGEGSRFYWYGYADFYSESGASSFSCRIGKGGPPRPDCYWESIQSTEEGRKKADQEGWVKYDTYYEEIGAVGVDNKMGGLIMDLLPELCPPLMEEDKLSGSVEIYELMKTLVEEMGLIECRGIHRYDDSPEYHSIDWKHKTAWSQDTLFRFGPDIPNRLIIPLEERRMPTAEEMKDERLNGSAIWSKNV